MFLKSLSIMFVWLALSAYTWQPGDAVIVKAYCNTENDIVLMHTLLSQRQVKRAIEFFSSDASSCYYFFDVEAAALIKPVTDCKRIGARFPSKAWQARVQDRTIFFMLRCEIVVNRETKT